MILLASASPRRRELLQMLGVPFTARATECDERCDERDPARYALEIATRKLRAAQDGLIQELQRNRKAAQGQAADNPLAGGVAVVAADTVVAIDGAVLGKPKDEADARAMLRRLSGRTHEVYTGVAVGWNDGEGTTAGERDFREYVFCERTAVDFRAMDEEHIAQYVASGEPLDKAGAYGIQGLGARFVRKIDGDFYNVMGLPVCRLLALLEDIGAI